MAAGEYGPLIALSLIYTAQSPGHNEVYPSTKTTWLPSGRLDIFTDTWGFLWRLIQEEVVLGWKSNIFLVADM